jgi:type II secretory pathway pseudopilin PulG
MDITTDGEHPDGGFGLVEIVVSMFMLAILAMAVLPLLIQGMTQSVANSTQATANQLVNDRMAVAQAAGPSCPAVAAVAGILARTDPHGVSLQVTTSVGDCPSGTGTVQVTSTVERLDTHKTLATASTLVYVAP